MSVPFSDQQFPGNRFSWKKLQLTEKNQSTLCLQHFTYHHIQIHNLSSHLTSVRTFILLCQMNPSSIMHPCSYTFLLSLIIFISSASSSIQSSSVSYSDHCSSIVPESSTTVRSYSDSLPHLSTVYYTGVEKFLGLAPSSSSNLSYHYYAGRSLRFPVAPAYYETHEKGIYKLEAYLYIRKPYETLKNARRNFTYGGSYYHRNISRRSSYVRFILNGFWSEVTRKLCMVGSASWQKEEGEVLNLDAVLKLKYPSLEAPTMHNSFVTGTLMRTGSSSVDDIDPVTIFSTPMLSDYRYSLVTKEMEGGFVSDVPRNLSHSLQKAQFCSILYSRPVLFELEYAADCKRKENCSPVDDDGLLWRFMSLYSIQCSENERKLRYMLTFQNVAYVLSFNSFSLNSTLVGEGSWDDENNQMLIVACEIVNASRFNENVVGDCSIRMSFRFPSILNIKNSAAIVGRIWTNRTVGDKGYFRQINLTSVDETQGEVFPGSRYEYTELDRVRESCPLKKLDKKKKDIYPNGHSYDMRFDMSVKNSKGRQFAWGYAVPLSVGDEAYTRSPMFFAMAPVSDVASVATTEIVESSDTPLNISYLITVSPYSNFEVDDWFPTANWSVNQRLQMEIMAEGVYDPRTGHLCMIGCRKLSSFFRNSTDDSRDCEILVTFDFVPLNDRKGGNIKGTIKSTRKKTDHLYFEEFSMSSAAYYQRVAERSIWRMDLEIILVLVSNTLLCLFIALQLFHVKRNPEIVSGISLIMLVVLSLGLMVPLVLNFEALFSKNQERQAVSLSNGGWLEGNEVAVRVVTMIAFLLQIRLLQLVWSAKKSDGNQKGSWAREKKAVFVTLPLYILGALLTILLNRARNRQSNQTLSPYGVYPKYSLWGNLRSYAGLILDGFLLPQILLNVFRGSAEKALSFPFYIGTSTIRVVPHAYDQYRARNYPTSFVNGTYYYANPGADFYSTAWDVIIPCGIIAFAVVVLLQQRRGGRCILPKRFRELELYEKVPVVENQS